MIYDLDNFASEQLQHYDYLIAGSGPAGAILADQLSSRIPQAKICIVESGRINASKYADELKTVLSDKLKIKKHSRERIVGGASTTWQGLCAPIEKTALEARPWLKDEGWPLSASELYSYYNQAAKSYNFPKVEMFDLSPSKATASSDSWLSLRKNGNFEPKWTNMQEKLFIQSNPIPRFDKTVIDLAKADKIDIFTNASLKKLEFVVAESGKSVSSAVVFNTKSETFSLKATNFLLATGGIENARILLNSKDADGNTLGNDLDQVGRYMMNHPKRYQGYLTFKNVTNLPYFFGCSWKGCSGYAGIRLSKSIQQKERLVNAYLRLEPIFPWTDKKGVEAFLYIVKNMQNLVKAWMDSKKGEVIELRSIAEAGDSTEIDDERPGALGLVIMILKDLPSVLHYLYFRLLKRPAIKRARLCSFLEMEPSASNRVLLSDQLDSDGYPLPLVSYEPTPTDRRSIELLTQYFVKEVESNGLGIVDDLFSVEGKFYESINRYSGFDASHHIGATRMGSDPKTSVVDPNLKAHDSLNLYIAGSSVFPNSCIANPTYTIAALSIRLSEHLANNKNLHS